MSAVKPVHVEAIEITGASRSPGKGTLDPITVMFRDFGGRGHVTVECYGAAWSCFFGAIGDLTLRDFIARCDGHYLATKLASVTCRKTTKREESYLVDICRAVIAALKGTA